MYWLVSDGDLRGGARGGGCDEARSLAECSEANHCGKVNGGIILMGQCGIVDRKSKWQLRWRLML